MLPELAAILDAIPPLPEVSPANVVAIRAEAEAGAAYQPRPSVHAVADRTIPGPAGDIAIRIYVPRSARPLPVLVFAHGGGWTICSIDTYDGLCREIANRGDCIVVSVEYRLAPEHVFPAAAEDFYAAARWVVQHAHEFGGDPARVAVGGDSAGGNLAAVAGLMARDRGGPRFAFALLAYPGLDGTSERPSVLAYQDTPILSRATERSMWHLYAAGEDFSHPYLSPLLADDLSGLPPTLIVTGRHDLGLDDAFAYQKAVTGAGGTVEVHVVEGAGHGFLSFFPFVPACSDALDHACGALREAMDPAERL
ncbi:alpha/beta hydrolase [Streptomyces phaeochromogenes]|uniref:alpha/beta hydrolase n=1 Tax=Streptomyces phaeochromogenes TaxID=1923 RepID=UPI00369938E5